MALKINWRGLANRFLNGMFNTIGAAIRAAVLTAVVVVAILWAWDFTNFHLKHFRANYGWMPLSLLRETK